MTPVSKVTPLFPAGRIILAPTLSLSTLPPTVQVLHGPTFTLPLGSVKFTPPVLALARTPPPVPVNEIVLPDTPVLVVVSIRLPTAVTEVVHC